MGIDGLDKSSASIRDMFAGVAPRYDLLNHVLSASLDVVWRRRAAAVLGPSSADPILDLCCGTGDQALVLGRYGSSVAAADFCLPMLAVAKRKFTRHNVSRLRCLAADALTLPFGSDSFGGATVTFGLRNVADLDRALTELARVLRPGGRLVILEFALPHRRPLRALYLLYFRHLLPLIGRVLSPRGSAYRYLSDSVPDFPQRDTFLQRMAGAGFTHLGWRDLSGGTVCLYHGDKQS
jgi:demethylmenaquinone methyltransferase/2-methoxy-6-polyprenyl-1,4-benzoquinol methylase